MKRIKFYLAVFLLCSSHHTHAQIITTIAGGDSLGLGDGGQATACELKFPYSTAIDAAGNLYIADNGNNRIRKVNTAGIITTIAGTGIPGYSGDDSAATSAKLNGPIGLAVDAGGNIFITDNGNSRVRKINASGIITTIAGTATYGYSGDNGPATSAELSSPHGIAIDESGNIYLCDPITNCIRKINTAGIITTIAGNGIPGYTGDNGPATAAKLDWPFGVAVDATGNIYFTEWNNNCVRKINAVGIITTIAGGNATLGFSGDNGPATAADFHIPIGIAIDNSGNIFIADSYNNRIRKINSSGNINTYAGDGIMGYNGDGGLATLAELNGPVGVSVGIHGDLYISEFDNFRIRYITSTESVGIINNLNDSLNIFPNPSNGTFNICNNYNTIELKQITIFNELGEKIKEINPLASRSSAIEMKVPDGIYFLVAITSLGMVNKKILISH